MLNLLKKIKHILKSCECRNISLQIYIYFTPDTPSETILRAPVSKIGIVVIKPFHNLLQINKLNVFSVRVDNEFRIKEFISFCLENGIILKPYSKLLILEELSETLSLLLD